MTVESAPAPQIVDVLALSPLQEGFFSLAQMSTDGVDVYTMQFIIDIGGPLDVAMLRRSADAVLERHPNLRVSFWDQDLPKPVQIVPSHAELPWSERSASPEEFDSIAEAERRARFDLTRGPALRVLLVNLPNDRRRMILTAHHILMDGWACAIFFQELIGAYDAGGQTDSMPAPRPYRDYIGWLGKQDTAAASQAWVEYLSRLSGPLMLADGGAIDSTESVPQSTRIAIDAADTARLVDWARSNGLTVNTVVQFAWAMVLGRLTDRRDIVFGTTISGRPESLPGVESMIGLFINTVPAFVAVEREQSVREQCARLQRESAAMRDLGFLSLSTVQRAVGQGNLFDTLFVYENAPLGSATQPVTTSDGTRFLPVTMESLAHYPLTVVAHVVNGSLIVIIEAVPEAIPHLSVTDIGARLVQVLRALPGSGDARPHEIDVLLPAERSNVERAAIAPPLADTDSAATVPELFRRQVEATPDAPALTTTDASYTYRELSEAASRLAAELSAHGVGPEDVVALAFPRSARSIVAILAVLETGAAYVPIDVAIPAARVESILRQAAPTVILTVSESAELVAGGAPVLTLDDPAVEQRIAAHPDVYEGPSIHPDQSAYLIFTSGSTGEPKGVIGTHRAAASYFADHRHNVYAPAVERLGRKMGIAHAWSLSFDASWQPLIGLLDGHAIHLFDAEEMRDAQRVVEGIVDRRLDMIDTSPSMFGQLSAAGLVEAHPTDDHHRLSVLALGGEAIGPALWAQLQSLPGTDVYNCYGPTETTVEALVATVREKSATPTVGGPTAGTSAYVLDSSLHVSPIGVTGELYLSGAQLTRGYVGKAGITAERFVADPFRAGERMYRTGDLVRRLPDGDLIFLGRSDSQVKVRGYRIEIGEIEAALHRLPGVESGAVVMVPRPSGAALVGFVAGGSVEADQSSRLRAELANHLPAYMVPTRIITLDRLPMTANGKLDANRLTDVACDALTPAAGSDGNTAPRTDTERALAEAFAELDGSAIGIDVDFFDLGLDSIVAISLVNKLRRAGLAVSPRMVLALPTIRDLAAAIDAGPALGESAEAAYGEVAELPIVSWMYEHGNFRRFTQTTLTALPADLTQERLEAVLQSLLDGHDMLRSTLSESDGGYSLVTREPGSVQAADIITRVDVDGPIEDVLTESARAAMDHIDPTTGAMIHAVWFRHKAADDVLLLTIHHLATDAVSWHVLFSDLAAATTGDAPATLGEFTTYRQWCDLMRARTEEPEVLAQQDYWLRQVEAEDPVIGDRLPDPTADTWSTLQVTDAHSTVATTSALLDKVTKDVGLREFLLTALTVTLATWRAERAQDRAAGALIALEGHGRDDDLVGDAVDTAQTVGWFTSVYPVRFGAGSTVDVDVAESDPAALQALLQSVVADLDAIPNRGLDYGLLKYGNKIPALVDAQVPQVEFNYLGRFDMSAVQGDPTPWTPIADLELNKKLPLDPEPDLPLRYTLDVTAVVQATDEGSQLVSTWRWSDRLFSHAEADRLATIWQRAVDALANMR